MALIKGGSGNDILYGLDGFNDVFDSDAGGNDYLYGYGGDDTYWLGYGTDHDTIIEYDSNSGDANDVIKLKEGIGTNDVRLSRSSYHLIVQLLDSNGSVSDSLTVTNYYTDDSAKIERVEFADDTVLWSANDFALSQVLIRGGSGNDNLYGSDNFNDVFDTDAGGNDLLHGYGGDDTYWLGYGTDHDTINEHLFNSGDTNDVIKLKEGIGTEDIHMVRSNDGDDLVVQLLASDGSVSDSLTVENYYTDDSAKIEQVEFDDGTVWGADDINYYFAIRGTSADENLYGLDNFNDVFDSDAGGDDLLYGYGGDDTYWLGSGTDHDTIREYYSNSGDTNDIIKLKEGIGTEDIQLVRGNGGDDLVVQLLASDGSVSDSLTVKNYHTDDSAKIERMEFADGTVWGADDFAQARIKGTSAGENLYGENDVANVFDSDAGGNDYLYGYGGDDTYWLGYGTDHDLIIEYYSNSGDANDVIKLKEGIGTNDVRLSRNGGSLVVQLLDSNGSVSDSLTVASYYTDDSAKIERVEFADDTVLWSANDFALSQVLIRGGSGNDNLYGSGNFNDVFDTDAGGNDLLHGYGGDDTYWLGYGTDHDTIREHLFNSGDTNDVIKLKGGIGTEDIQLVRGNGGDDLIVQLLASDGSVSDSLTVENYYTDDSAKIERVEFDDGTVWGADDINYYFAIRGTSADENLYGLDNFNDVFDSDAGGDDLLYGYGGDDTYWLGSGTDHDTIKEYDSNSGDTNDIIKLKEGIGTEDIQLVRGDDGDDLVVQLLASDGSVSDSLTVENYHTDDSAKIEQVEFDDGTVWGADDLAQARIKGTSAGENLYGENDVANVFDSDAGGNDQLYGYGGDDTYWLGYGTDHDTIKEYDSNIGDANDVIKLKEGIGTNDVRLSRNGGSLVVQLLDSNGSVSDSLTVENYYTDDSAKIERVEFADDTVLWSANDFALSQVLIRGGSDNDTLLGLDNFNDVFDSDAGGDDLLYGYGGDDTYWLGYGTDHDTIREHLFNSGDTNDVIKLKGGIGTEDIQLVRGDDGDDLVVQLLASDGSVADSLTVENYHTDDSAKIEQVEFDDGTVWGADDLAQARIKGTSAGENLYGENDVANVFDSDAGGNDYLYGYGGDDTYWLGYGTDHDTIIEYDSNSGDANDVIKLKEGIGTNDVRLSRSSYHLIVQLLDSNGSVSDSLTVTNYYTDDSAKIERVEFADDTVLWSANDFALSQVLIRGGSGNDNLYGSDNFNDVFDTDAGGNDLLHGYGGDDTYWLGYGTDHDTINEHLFNSGDTNDVIKLKEGIGTEDIHMVRSNDGDDLVVQLLASDGSVSDSLTVENYYTDDSAKIEQVEFDDGTVWGADDINYYFAIRGTSADENLYGLDNYNDIFDSDAGGNDNLYGYGGDDTYWLGSGTGHDTIREYYSNSGDANDVIKLKEGIGTNDVQLVRGDDGDDLIVQLLASDGSVSDSLTVANYHTDDSAKIEQVEFDDGTVWGANDFAQARIKGTSADENLYGENDVANIFDSDAGGDDQLYGYGGDDTYWLGYGTDHDTIKEYDSNSGDANDVIKLKEGIGTNDVRLSRNGGSLVVQLLDSNGSVSDSLTVENYYTDDSAKIERVEFADDTVLWSANDFALSQVLIRGGSDNDTLLGLDNFNDVFDSDAGGDDQLYGYGGDDTYWLGYGTGHDTIREYDSNIGDANDVIKLKGGIGTNDVQMVRSNDGDDLIVQLLASDGSVSDSLTVENYYTDDSAKIEQVEFDDGTVWDADDINYYFAIRGTSADEDLYGLDNYNDIFDSDAGGNDNLYGYGGDDTYWLGSGTGHDTIKEYDSNSGDANDVIKLKGGIGTEDIQLVRGDDGDDLVVQLLASDGSVADSLTVENYHTDDSAKIEQVEFDDGTVWGADDLAQARIKGTSADENLYGENDVANVFDSDAGGNDQLYGYGGDDTYWLGYGTDHDRIREYLINSGDANDVIKLKEGIGTEDVQLVRYNSNLVVQLLANDGSVSDSLTVINYYTDDSAKIERVEFADGTVLWSANDFAQARIRGGSGNNSLYGLDNYNDVFDADAGGDDQLYGYGGDDTYWLGYGTDHDTINEYDSNSGDANDVIKLKEGIGTNDVQMVRSNDGDDLIVQLLASDGSVSDSLTVENYYTDDSAKIEQVEFADGTVLWSANDFAQARIRGGSGNDDLYGLDNYNDVFDSDAGGDDQLYGYGGDDTYWLGYGTGHDTINESGGDDVIKLKGGIGTEDVQLVRGNDGDDLVVQLLASDGSVSDSLTVANYYTDDSAKIEQVEFDDGTVWGADDFAQVRIRGTSADENLYGDNDVANVFDSDAGGDDQLYGYGGDDTYWLGYGTDHDTIIEYDSNSGDANDVIKLKEGIGTNDVRLSRNGGSLVVQLLDSNGSVSDSLTVENYYTDDSAKIERVEFADDTVLWSANDFALSQVLIRGGSDNDTLLGSDNFNDVFDSDAGGDDQLYGYGGDDTYWLGYGTGHDTIREYDSNSGDANDVIKLKGGIGTNDVQMVRSNDGDDLIVQLLASDGSVSDSLTVANYYTDDSAKIEQVEFDDGTVWDAYDIDYYFAIRGTSADEDLYGLDNYNDIFDSDAGGNDNLYGYGGDDTYWLGSGTGHDTIKEYDSNSGDANDVIKLKGGIGTEDIQLVRGDDGDDLVVQLLASDGSVSDSLTVENYHTDDSAKIEQVEFDDGTVWGADDLAQARIKGTSADENLYGENDVANVFDADAGGDDQLYGYGGDDTYWLGYGTGHDTIREYDSNSGDANDVIKLKEGIGTNDVQLVRGDDGDDLIVQLLASDGSVSDSLTVENYYTDDSAKIEQVEFDDGTVWGADDFAQVRIRGTSADENLYGDNDVANVFDADAGGDDQLYGYGGDDTYWLGYGTDHDTIIEYDSNSGDANDVIKLKEGIGTNDVRLSRNGGSLVVQLLDSNGSVSDSLTVENYYTDDSAKIERVEFADDTVLWSANDFALSQVLIRGGSDNDTLLGSDNFNDVFDSDAGGDDQLYGYGGDDTYWLGYGTGHDTIREYDSNIGDANDVIKLKGGIGTNDVQMVRSNDGDDLIVQLLASDGSVSDSLTVENYYTDDSAKIEQVEFDDGTVWDAYDIDYYFAIRGTSADEDLYGLDNYNDIFDSDAGGNDNLYGYGGDDTYWLGSGTGHDTIKEYDSNIGDANDVIKLKGGIGTEDIQLVRGDDGDDLVVQLLASDGSVSDSLTVENYHTDDSAKIEQVEFDDGTVWGANDLAQARIKGTSADENLYGENDVANVFDSDAGGNDQLYGYGGDDTYWLGYGTDHDRIREYLINSGDANDVIKLKEGIGTNDVRLSRYNSNLVVQLLANDGSVSDSLTVINYYTDDSAKIERVEFADGTVLWSANDFAQARIRGGSGNNSLYGLDNYNDVFDADAGGDDQLYGYGGDDTYWLGYGTDHDTINESGGDDVIKLKEGIGTNDVQLVRGNDGDDLVVQLLAIDGSVSDSLTVANYYTDDSAKIEQVEFDDGTVWDAYDIDYYFAIRGTSVDENLYGLDNFNDIFNSDAGGNDNLYGYGGDDTYWLGSGTGHDTIREYDSNIGDANDVIKLAEGIGTNDVRLSRNAGDLIVQLLANDGSVSDSLTVENYYTDDSAKIEQVKFADDTVLWSANDFAQARIRGGSSNDDLYGLDNYDDVFDADAGGDDQLYGYGGDDTYWLGSGTGHDTINESGGDDVIKLAEGIGTDDVQLSRSNDGNNLVVQLLASDGSVSDSLTVANYYTDDSAKIEQVEFADGTVLWSANDFAQVRIRGGSSNDDLYGLDNYDDVFDADAGGDDRLYGYGGDDTYWLGYGTGHDTIREYDSNIGDANDVIKLAEGIGTDDVQLSRSNDGNNLVVQLLASDGSVSDSLTVANYYTDDSAKIEQVEFDDGTVLWSANDFAQVRIRGGSSNDDLYGLDNYDDVFDADAGGDDQLYGYGGDDTYWLGYGTGHDTINESGGDDVIKLAEGIGTDDVQLSRSNDGNNLVVQLLASDGSVSDSLTVVNYYTDDSAKIEQVEFADGTVLWSANDFAQVRIRGGSSNDDLYGLDNYDDVFDADAGGDDQLYGYGGDDTYWLGYGTGHDTIREYDSNIGDANDVIKLAEGIGTNDVQLSRSNDGNNLVVQLLASDGSVSDSLTVANYYTDDSAKIEQVEFADGTVLWSANDFAQVRIRGGSSNDDLYGSDNYNDVFDADAGGDDQLYGYGGDDTYWLGYGTGHDTIREYDSNIGDANDVIKLAEGIGTNDVRLSRNAGDLIVQLLANDGSVSDSLTVENYYTDDSAKIEQVEFADGTVLWSANDFAQARIRGGSNNDDLYGLDNYDDVFDSDAGGNDQLYGYGGDDTYWLGSGTGHDTIKEYDSNSGDANDVIKLKGGIGTNDVQLARSNDGDDLIVQLLASDGSVSDSLTVENYYTDNSAKIERVEFADGTVWSADDINYYFAIRGTSADENLYGLDNYNDIFDADAGGDDQLYGYGGDDTYWLGYGTDHDTIIEYDSNSGDANDAIKLKGGIGTEDVQMVRSNDGYNLVVQLLASDGSVSDSLTVVNYYTDDSAKIERVEFADGTVLWSANDFAQVRIRGGSGNDYLYGLDNYNDVFDADAGGNDRLYGYGGDDTYWLGSGTGHDTIREYDSNSGDANDVIKLKGGIGTNDVRLSRNSDNLVVQLLASDGSVSDSLTVVNYYTDDSAKIERVEFADDTVLWSANDFTLAQVWIRGGSGNDNLYGLDNYNDVFDSDAGGNDQLYGYGGDDTYWLGYGTGHDTIREYDSNSGDANDVIKLKGGIGTNDVQLVRSNDGDDLVVQLLASDGSVSDSLTVANYYTDDSAKIERVEFADGTVLWSADDLAQARIRGTSADENLYGLDNFNDVFDADAGGDDQLYGYGGDDTYWLGYYGTGHDTIREYDSNSGDANDVIKLKGGIGTNDVRLSRSNDGDDLIVQLLANNGSVSDSLTVVNYYTDDSAKIERVEFDDGTVWGADDLAQARIRGGSSNDDLYGLDNYNDVFDADAGGDDQLYGYGGDDTYWLGYGTGHDTIREYDNNSGDANDVINSKRHRDE